MKKVKWGILSTAKIGTQKVIPGLLKSDQLEIHAIASRNLTNAKKHADTLGIPNAYDTYEALLEDPEIDIIYNPLPNHLHVEWTAKAIQAGKHVLCEKPLFLDPTEAQMLIQMRDKYQVKVGEAFMVKSHPQWKKAFEIIHSKDFGDILTYNATFSYYNVDPNNIRNIAAYGGGALWDIGCYPTMTSRYLFKENPLRVQASIKNDPEFKTDVLSTALLEFPNNKKATFSVSTQASPYQRVHVLGTKMELEIIIPFNAPLGEATSMKINTGDITLKSDQWIEIPPCDQYQLQGEEFTTAVLNDTEVPVTLEDAHDHSRIITALFEAAKKEEWVEI